MGSRRAARPRPLRGRRGVDLGAPGAGELDRKVSDAAGATVDQHFLPAVDLGTVDEPFPGRDRGERQGGRLAHADRGRLAREETGVHGRVLRERSLQVADAAGQSVDVVTGPEVLDAGPGLLDRTGQIEAEDGGRPDPRVRGLSGADLGVQGIDPAGLDPDQDLSRLRCGPGDLPHVQ